MLVYSSFELFLRDTSKNLLAPIVTLIVPVFYVEYRRLHIQILQSMFVIVWSQVIDCDFIIIVLNH